MSAEQLDPVVGVLKVIELSDRNEAKFKDGLTNLHQTCSSLFDKLSTKFVLETTSDNWNNYATYARATGAEKNYQLSLKEILKRIKLGYGEFRDESVFQIIQTQEDNSRVLFTLTPDILTDWTGQQLRADKLGLERLVMAQTLGEYLRTSLADHTRAEKQPVSV